jgi:tetratricopeptide (TPR) repeat protein
MKTLTKIPQLAGMLLLAVCISLTAYPTPMSFKRTFELASGNFQVQHYDVALPLLLELQQKQPANANISYMIGVCYLNLKQEQFKAVPYLEAAVQNRCEEAHNVASYKEQHAPDMSLFSLAQAYHYAGRFEEAISFYLDASSACIKQKKGVVNRKLYNDIHRNIDDCKRQMQQLAEPVSETSDAVLYW